MVFSTPSVMEETDGDTRSGATAAPDAILVAARAVR
jgi:hypothetical protein